MAKSYTLDDILQKPVKVEIPVPGKTVKNKEGMPETAKMTFWARPSTQAERDLAAAAARKASRTLRKILETDGTEERELLVLEEVEGASIDSLRALWVNDRLINRAMMIRQRSLEDRDEHYIPEPDGDVVTSKEMDDYENAVEDAEDQREMGVMEAVEAAQAELEKESERIPEEELIKLAIPAQVENVANRAYETEFSMQLIYRCTFADKACKKKAFSAVDDVHSLKDQPLTKLANVHMSFILDPEKVKNLAGGLRR